MGYSFPSLERGTASGNAAETCALLHLMCFADEKDEIDLFAIDCFNDVTGMDNGCFTLHDVQSKAGKDTGPAKLGEYLATLFENSVSEFSQYFVTLTLFVGGVSSGVREDPTMETFGFHDMKPKAQKSVREHLIATCRERHDKMFEDLATDENIDDFLCRVRIVTAKADPTEYIRALAHDTSALLPGRKELLRIFGQIRDKQSGLKNRDGILSATIDRPDEVMDYGRVLKANEIKLLIIERLLNRDYFRDAVPDEFQAYLDGLPPEEDEQDVVEDCRLEMFRQYFDKNDADAFWAYLDEIVSLVKSDSKMTIQQIYDAVSDNTLKACRHMTRRSHLFFISIVKDGLQR